jgi:NTE family protein
MKLGIALGSGGARGLAHIAYLEALDRLRVRPVCISGSSMGALVGALYAGGMNADAMRKLALGVSLIDIPRLVDFAGPRDAGIIKGRKIEEWLGRTLPVKRFEDLEIPLKIVATDFWRGEQVVFDTGDLVPAIRASISIPGVFEPYELGGRLLVDGGVVNPVPVDLLPGAQFIVGIDVSGEQECEMPGKDLPSGVPKNNPGRIEVLLRTYDIMGKIITEERLHDRRGAIYLHPQLKGFRVSDFLKASEILASVSQDAESFRRRLLARKVGSSARE